MNEIEKKMERAVEKREQDQKFNTPPEGYKPPHQYVEAFCLMTYQGKLSPLGGVAPTREVIWNSRNGVTPFCVRSRDGKEELTHVNWRGDKQVPYHTPTLGDRVFVDLTPARAQEIARKRLASLQEKAKAGNQMAKEQLDDIEQECIEDLMDHEEKDPFSTWIMRMRDSYLQNPGAPDLIEVDQAFLDRLAKDRQGVTLGRPPLGPSPLENPELAKAVERLREERHKQSDASTFARIVASGGGGGSIHLGGPNATVKELQEAMVTAVINNLGPLFNGPITIERLVFRALENSKAKGFYPTQMTKDAEGNPTLTITFVNIPEKLLLIHSEVTEACEAARDKSHTPKDRWKSPEGKPEGFGAELADIIIRTAGLAGALGIDLDTEIREKMEYNLGRPYQHGKKYEHGK